MNDEHEISVSAAGTGPTEEARLNAMLNRLMTENDELIAENRRLNAEYAKAKAIAIDLNLDWTGKKEKVLKVARKAFASKRQMEKERDMALLSRDAAKHAWFHCQQERDALKVELETLRLSHTGTENKRDAALASAKQSQEALAEALAKLAAVEKEMKTLRQDLKEADRTISVQHALMKNAEQRGEEKAIASQIHIPLAGGATARISEDAPPELEGALNAMVEHVLDAEMVSRACKEIAAAAWAAGCENKDQVIGFLSRQVFDLRGRHERMEAEAELSALQHRLDALESPTDEAAPTPAQLRAMNYKQRRDLDAYSKLCGELRAELQEERRKLQESALLLEKAREGLEKGEAEAAAIRESIRTLFNLVVELPERKLASLGWEKIKRDTESALSYTAGTATLEELRALKEAKQPINPETPPSKND